MTEKRKRRSSLMGSLQVLGSTFGTRHGQWGIEGRKNITNGGDTCREVHRCSPLSSITIGTCYSSQWQPIVHTCRRNSMPPSKQNQLLRCNDVNNDPRGPDIRSRLQAQGSYVGAQHRASSTRKLSRIPTPSKFPAGDLYSHEIYRNEIRRSVLSSLERRRVDMNKDTGTVHKANIDKKEESEKLIRRVGTTLSFNSERNILDIDATSNSWLQARTHSQRTTTKLSPKEFSSSMHPVNSTSLPRATALRASCPCNLLESPDARSRPATRLFNPMSEFISHLETDSQGNDCIKNDHSASDPIFKSVKTLPSRKERIETHTLPKGKLLAHYELLDDHRIANSNAIGITTESGEMEHTKKGLRWTNGFENLKLGTKAKNDTFSLPNHPKAPSRGTTRLSPLPDTGSLRRRDQMGRMVLSRNRPVGFRSKLKKPGLTVHTDWVSQVNESQPQQYWLGRFVTLINAFHYEDSFHEPDIATGFGMLSSYSRPLGPPDSDEAGYRIKRAFMVLENVCMNDEASASLQKFRYEYIGKCGDGWLV
ncbi:hypothetical protein BDV26DRAFT_272578 [Aspergillus bertholletiae]|uniref:Uncharacterized protein n=1 Tax=Aspergillus bertholletiae TaxID=1226010 RepID=A0A5N7AWN4_9EURO|nr:hypothetical protein BDV26DRAFT_272578 [Aspergillus bertholletiae]